MEWLQNLDPDKIVQWLYLLVAVVGVVKAIRAKSNMDKWTMIRESVPLIHGVVQKAASLTATKKDDAFVAQIRKLLEAAGFNLDITEEAAVKALGEGFHQEFKLDRAAVGASVAMASEPSLSAEGNAPTPAQS